MDALWAEFAHPTHLSFPVIAARLLLGAVLGGLIGLEREWRHHPAGLRTHILVSLAAATFAVLGVEIVHNPQFVSEAARLDPLRLIEAVTAGIAFLAAGTIIFARGKVHGLTTGAGMWLAGAIGLASGLGMWQVAVLATGLALIVLWLMHSLSDVVGGEDTDEGPRQDQPSQKTKPSTPRKTGRKGVAPRAR